MQLINKILFVALASGAGVYWWTKEQARVEYDRQVGALATTMDRRMADPMSPSGQADALFMRSLVILADFRDLKQRKRLEADETDFLNDALSAAGYNNPSEIGAISRNLRENITVCQQLKIFGDGSGSQAMLTGQAPVIQSGPFKSESLILVRRLSPQMAPEVVNHPANFALVPDPAADLIWPFTVNNQVLQTAADLKTANVLDTASYDIIRRQNGILKE
ncbi:MAG: hypothetical protein JWM59_1374 [Verrucomicrobiales bacterium]|nr:hypothetical protein [Verrucomicrobiales bacterium]